MYLAQSHKLNQKWTHALNEGANIILMRHAPKADSDNSDLSTEGEELAKAYGYMLDPLTYDLLVNLRLYCTSKGRTANTLKLLFPKSNSENFIRFPELDAPKVSNLVQDQCNNLHVNVGHWRGYYLNHTYYFLEKLGGKYDKENIHTVVAERMILGIRKLSNHPGQNLYCGHSPTLEVACEHLLNTTLAELGGFLNPLDSIHLKMSGNKVEFVARINPIVGYADLESEAYYKISA